MTTASNVSDFNVEIDPLFEEYLRPLMGKLALLQSNFVREITREGSWPKCLDLIEDYLLLKFALKAEWRLLWALADSPYSVSGSFTEFIDMVLNETGARLEKIVVNQPEHAQQEAKYRVTPYLAALRSRYSARAAQFLTQPFSIRMPVEMTHSAIQEIASLLSSRERPSSALLKKPGVDEFVVDGSKELRRWSTVFLQIQPRIKDQKSYKAENFDAPGQPLESPAPLKVNPGQTDIALYECVGKFLPRAQKGIELVRSLTRNNKNQRECNSALKMEGFTDEEIYELRQSRKASTAAMRFAARIKGCDFHRVQNAVSLVSRSTKPTS